MSEYRLVPLPRGYYTECDARNEPSLAADLHYLLSGDDATIDLHTDGFTVRSQVLVVADD